MILFFRLLIRRRAAWMAIANHWRRECMEAEEKVRNLRTMGDELQGLLHERDAELEGMRNLLAIQSHQLVAPCDPPIETRTST